MYGRRSTSPVASRGAAVPARAAEAPAPVLQDERDDDEQPGGDREQDHRDDVAGLLQPEGRRGRSGPLQRRGGVVQPPGGDDPDRPDRQEPEDEGGQAGFGPVPLPVPEERLH